MRILLVNHVHPPRHRAGVESYTASLAVALSGKGPVQVATTEKIPSLPTGETRKYSLDGVPVFEVVSNHDFEGFLGGQRQAAMEAAFARILDEVRPDIVHFQHLLWWSLRLPEVAAGRGIKTLYTAHDFWLVCPRMGQMVDWRGEVCSRIEPSRCAECIARTAFDQGPRERRWMRRLQQIRRVTGLALERPLRRLEALRRRLSAGARKPPVPPAAADIDRPLWLARREQRQAWVREAVDRLDLVISPSARLGAFLVDEGLPAAKIRHLPHGLDPGPFLGLEKPSRRDRLVVGFLGTLAPHKGLHVLLDAVLGMDPSRIELRVNGPAPRADYLASCRAKAGSAPHVRFGPPVPRSEVPAHLAGLDLFAMPSVWPECQPLTILESFLARTPCLVSDLGGMAELVEEGRGGLRARADDAADWRRALQSLVDRPERLRELGETIPRVPSLDEHVESLLGIYADLKGSS